MPRRKRRKARRSEPDLKVTPAMVSAAKTAMARNKARVDAGETFAGHKPSDWRLGGRKRREWPA